LEFEDDGKRLLTIAKKFDVDEVKEEERIDHMPMRGLLGITD